MTFINFSALLDSGLHDGVAKTLLDDLNSKLLKNEFGHVMSQYVNSQAQNNENSGPGQNMNMDMARIGMPKSSSSGPSSSSSTNIFKRYSLIDLFDE